MTDYFALLGEPRRPHLDGERIKETFHRLSRARHPDQDGGTQEDFSELNVAQETLRNPTARLRHLLDLEHPGAASVRPANVPEPIAQEFAFVHQILRDLDAFVPRKQAATGALAKVLLSREDAAVKSAAQECLARLQGLLSRAELDLEDLSKRWDSRSADAEGELIDLYQRFAFLSRWIEQLRERMFQLES